MKKEHELFDETRDLSTEVVSLSGYMSNDFDIMIDGGLSIDGLKASLPVIEMEFDKVAETLAKLKEKYVAVVQSHIDKMEDSSDAS